MQKPILIIDDDDFMIKITSFIVKRLGYTSIYATSIKDATDLLITHQPELVITDDMLPDIDRNNVIPHIRKHAIIQPYLIAHSVFNDVESEYPATVSGRNGKAANPLAVSMFK